MENYIDVLLEKLEQGVLEGQAIEETVYQCHKYSLRGRNIQDSTRILKEQYYGNDPTTISETSTKDRSY